MAQPILGLHIFVPFATISPRLPLVVTSCNLRLAVALAVTYLSRYPPLPRRYA